MIENKKTKLDKIVCPQCKTTLMIRPTEKLCPICRNQLPKPGK